MADPVRELLGKVSSLSSRQRVFRTLDTIEVEESEGYDLARRRVWLDEVLLVTYHRKVGWAFVIAMVAFIGLFGFMGLIIAVANRSAAAFAFLAAAVLPFALALALRLILRLDVVTVYGRRTKAEMHFWFGKARAREVFQQVGRLARERQERLRGAPPPRRPAPAPPPLPPPLPPVVG